MDSQTTYAVIDLETTGTEINGTDRIIQFGCALIKNGTLIQTRSQLINPDRPVPPAIQALTGITPGRLVAAPYFEDVAASITRLLQGTVIVAHNVNFDYPFLAAELVRAGQPALTQPGVDTVEMAQILLPTQASFRLQDLTAALGITHDHPHRADSDAISTGHLLMRLGARFAALPTATQHELLKFAGSLPKQTGDFLAAHATAPKPLTAEQMAVGRFVLQRPHPRAAEQTVPTYPATLAAKRQLLKPRFKVRTQQAKMMDAIYENSTSAHQPLLIEAGTGLGKTLGYLLPYAYLTSPSHKLVVSAATTVLERQIATESLPQVRALTGLALPAVVLKSARHYLDLGKFAASLGLKHPNHQTRLLQMRLMVWLTQTTTGDLAELQLTTYSAPLFARIRATGRPPKGTYREADFYQRLQNQVKTAQVVITNHAFLARHIADLPLRSKPYLVVDEAQHFAAAFAEANSHELGLAKLKRRLGQLQTFIQGRKETGLQTLFADAPATQYQLSRTLAAINTATDQIAALQQEIYHHCGQPAPRVVERPLTATERQWLLPTLQAALPPLLTTATSVLAPMQGVLAEYEADPERFLASEAALFQGLDGLTAALSNQLTRLKGIDLPALAQAPVVTSLILGGGGPATLSIHWQRFDASQIIQKQLAVFEAPVFTGATLTVNRSFDYLTQQLGLPADTPALRLRSPFHYKLQAQFLVAEDAPNARELSETAYADYLANAIAQLAATPHQTLVLFNSLRMIGLVYQRLINQLPEHELLAQGVTGSAEKIAKRFALSTDSVLLGAASFFEGIDYPQKQLEQVILTRLPFDSPASPTVQARAAALKARGEDAFAADLLPKATIRFRQSFGRLIRTEHDRGVFVVLDPRLLTTPYGRQMAKSLPNLKPKALPLAELTPLAHDFLEHRLIKETEHAQ